MCCLSPSLSAWDDPAPLRDTVWQLLLCGQQAGDAQQGRLFLQRRAVGKPPSCNPPPFLSCSFPVLDIFDNPAITSGPETDELMDKSLALNTHVSFPVKLHAFPFRYWAARPIRFLPLPLFFFFFCRNTEFCKFYPQFASACVSECVGSKHMRCLYIVLLSVCICGFQFLIRKTFLFYFVCFGRETEVKQTRRKHRMRQRRKWNCPKSSKNKKNQMYIYSI